MTLRRRAVLLSGLALAACARTGRVSDAADAAFAASPFRSISDADWKRRLPPESYRILRRAGTEAPGTSPLLDEHRIGTFVCKGCQLPLFESAAKFDSGTGWPSFFQAISGHLGLKADYSMGLPRIEYHCAQCLGHQGHRFNDGPAPTGLRYCNDGVALDFMPTPI